MSHLKQLAADFPTTQVDLIWFACGFAGTLMRPENCVGPDSEYDNSESRRILCSFVSPMLSASSATFFVSRQHLRSRSGVFKFRVGCILHNATIEQPVIECANKGFVLDPGTWIAIRRGAF